MAINGPSSSSAATQDYMENGRLYHGYRKGMYMYPCDESEKNRMDMFHQLFLTARRDELHTARVESTDDVRILDLGTGTGIWAIDMADKFRNAEVVGIDLANIQPKECLTPQQPAYPTSADKTPRIPRNLRFNVRMDYLSPWTLGEDSWDLIHLRQAAGSVQSWPALYQKIFSHLKPGVGSLEQVEIDLTPRSDDGTLPEKPMNEWYNYLVGATGQASRPIAYQTNTRAMLEAAGFVHIQEQVIRLPYNSWPRDPYQKGVGRWYCAGMLDWVEALSMQPFTKVYGWKPEEFRHLLDSVTKTILNKKMHGYNNLHVWTAKRPRDIGT